MILTVLLLVSFSQVSLLFSCFSITLIIFSCERNSNLRRKKKVSKEKKVVWVNVCPDKWFLLCTTSPGKIKGETLGTHM